MKDTNSKVDIGKTIIVIRSIYDSANSISEEERARERVKALCKANGLKWYMVLAVDIDNIRWAIQKNDLKNFLL